MTYMTKLSIHDAIARWTFSIDTVATDKVQTLILSSNAGWDFGSRNASFPA